MVARLGFRGNRRFVKIQRFTLVWQVSFSRESNPKPLESIVARRLPCAWGIAATTGLLKKIEVYSVMVETQIARYPARRQPLTWDLESPADLQGESAVYPSAEGIVLPRIGAQFSAPNPEMAIRLGHRADSWSVNKLSASPKYVRYCWEMSIRYENQRFVPKISDLH